MNSDRLSVKSLHELKSSIDNDIRLGKKITLRKKYLELLDVIEYDFMSNFIDIFHDSIEGQKYFNLLEEIRAILKCKDVPKTAVTRAAEPDLTPS